MDSQKQQAAQRIKESNNILVTVSSNPSVDQLAACIGLTLALNKMGKHATAVFSGAVPSTIEFLQPEKTIEKNTDSLRDFIIALDKSKADKLRYKVEDRVVKIFITPYRTSINEKDLEFSQGDFNVDVVVALGVHSQADLDQAITSHGRILHDATVVTINVKPGGELGGINWLDPTASSLSELTVELVDALDKKMVDNQIATALLTGIVAETDRFSNAKTSPKTMSISAELMGEGANQQLVATKLEEPALPPSPPVTPIAQQTPQEPVAPTTDQAVPPAKPVDDGTLEIAHDDKQASPAPAKESQTEPPKPLPPAPEEKPAPIAPQIHIDEHGSLQPLQLAPEEALLPPKTSAPAISHHSEPPKMVLEPPTGVQPEGDMVSSGFGPNTAMGLPPVSAASPVVQPPASPAASGPIIISPSPAGDEMPSGGPAPADSFLVGGQPGPAKNTDAAQPDMTPPTVLPGPDKTLSDIEKDVHSSHLAQPPSATTVPDMPIPPAGSSQIVQSAIPPAFAPPEPRLPVKTAFADSVDASMPAFAPPTPPVSFEPAVPLAPVSSNPNPAPVADAIPTVDMARDAVAQAINETPASLPPEQALPVSLPLSPVDIPNGPDAATPGQGLPPASEGQTLPQLAIPTTPPPPGPPPMLPPANPY